MLNHFKTIFFPPDNKAQVQRGEGEGSDKVRPKTQVGHFFHGFPK